VALVTSLDTLTIRTNFWRIPSPERALDGLIEGYPSPEKRQIMIEEAKAARAAWKPSDESFNLVEQLNCFSGSKVGIQFWDPVMYLLESEGPFAIEANCIGVTLLQDDGYLQAYLMVEGVKEIPNADGYSPSAYLQQRADCEYLLAPVADLYSITKIGSKPE